jgi:endonuclease YncB( thermonuclease family)
MLVPWLMGAGLLIASSTWTFSADLISQASIIDGDALEIHSTRIRLWGIDALESNQFCRGEDSVQYRRGAKTANGMAAFIGGRLVSCAPMTLDRYGHTVAPCAVAGAVRATGHFAKALRSRTPPPVLLATGPKRIHGRS